MGTCCLCASRLVSARARLGRSSLARGPRYSSDLCATTARQKDSSPPLEKQEFEKPAQTPLSRLRVSDEDKLCRTRFRRNTRVRQWRRTAEGDQRAVQVSKHACYRWNHRWMSMATKIPSMTMPTTDSMPASTSGRTARRSARKRCRSSLISDSVRQYPPPLEPFTRLCRRPVVLPPLAVSVVGRALHGISIAHRGLPSPCREVGICLAPRNFPIPEV